MIRTYMRIGCDLTRGKSGGISNLTGTITEIPTLGGTALQIYISIKRGWKMGSRIRDDDLQTAIDILQATGIYVIVHGKLLYNFARAGTWMNQNRLLGTELQESARFGASLVIHQGKYLEMDQMLSRQNYVENLTEIVDQNPTLTNYLVLENSSHQGTEMGYTLTDLVLIDQMFPERVRLRIKYCLDLCHVFVSGELDMRDPHQVRSWLARFDSELGLKRLEVVHFNDSSEPFASQKDHHADLRCGFIGNPALGGSTRGYHELIRILKAYDVPLILETAGNYIPLNDQIKLIRSWSIGDQKYEEIYLNQYLDRIQSATHSLSTKGKVPHTRLSLHPLHPLHPLPPPPPSVQSVQSVQSSMKIKIKLRSK